MANSLGTLAGSLVLQRALDLVFTKRPLLKNISLNLRNLDGSVTGKLNQAVYTRTLSIPGVSDFGSASADKNDTDISTTITAHKQIQFTITPAQYNATDRRLIDETAEPMAVALANHMVDTIAAVWTAGNFANNTVKAAGWDYEHLNTVRAVLIGRGIPDGQRRFYVGNGDVYKALLQDTLIVTALNNPNNAGAIQTGMLPQVLGFGIDEYPACPTTGNLVGFSGTPDSVILAVRVPDNPETLFAGNVRFPGAIGVITEPVSGLSVMVSQWIGTDLTANTRLNWMYGTSVGNTNNGQRITSV